MGLGILAGAGKLLAPATVKAAGATAGALSGTAAGGIMQSMLPVIAAQAGASAIPGAALMAAGGGLAALQSLGQAKYDAKMFDLQATDAKIAGKQAINDARGRALAIQQENNRHLGHVLNMQAFKGQIGMASAEAAYRDEAETGTFNRQMELLSGKITAGGHKTRQSLYKTKADHARRQGRADVFGTLFKTGASIFGPGIAEAAGKGLFNRALKKSRGTTVGGGTTLNLEAIDRYTASYL